MLCIWTALMKYTFWFCLSCIETSGILSESPVKLWVLNWMFRLQCFLWKPNKLYGFNRDGEYKLFFFAFYLIKPSQSIPSFCETACRLWICLWYYSVLQSLCLYVCARIILLSFGIEKKPFKWTKFYGQGSMHFVAPRSQICYRIYSLPLSYLPKSQF